MTLSPCPVFIGGEWTHLSGLATTPVHNPSTGDVIAEAPLCAAQHVNDAAEAAEAAFPAWSETPPVERARIFFRFKMLLLLLAGLNVLIFHSRVLPKAVGWDLDPVPPRPARIAGALSLTLWVGIIVSGRMIAYNWFDCDRQPQPAIVNFLTSCSGDAVP